MGLEAVKETGCDALSDKQSMSTFLYLCDVLTRYTRHHLTAPGRYRPDVIIIGPAPARLWHILPYAQDDKVKHF